MQLRQNRRRLVVSDESAATDPAAESPRAARSSAERGATGAENAPYAAAVEREQARRILDLLPTRYRTLSLLFVLGVAVVAGLEVLYASLPKLARLVAAENLVAIDLAGGRGLANWFSSCLLGAGGAIALLIYMLRRHRGDDYHGRYRLWLWTVAALALLSMDEICELHRLGPALLSSAAAWCSLSETQLWGGVAGVAAGIVVVRLIFEIRRSKLAIAALVAATGSLAGATAVDYLWLPLEQGNQAILIEAGMRMAGHLLLFFALLLYARHVVRDAQGLLPAVARKVKPKKQPKAEKAKSTAATTPVSPPAVPKPHFSTNSDLKSSQAAAPESRPAAAQASRATPAKPQAVATATRSDEDEESQETRGMTRAERKKLRRQVRQNGDSSDD